MKLARMIAVGLLSAVFGVVSGVLANGSTVGADVNSERKACSNTFCLPEDTVCYEYQNWTCVLSGGCSGGERCN
jgi:hypothetical protein